MKRLSETQKRTLMRIAEMSAKNVHLGNPRCCLLHQHYLSYRCDDRPAAALVARGLVKRIKTRQRTWKHSAGTGYRFDGWDAFVLTPAGSREVIQGVIDAEYAVPLEQRIADRLHKLAFKPAEVAKSGRPAIAGCMMVKDGKPS